jgi:hypothetical protein
MNILKKLNVYKDCFDSKVDGIDNGIIDGIGMALRMGWAIL